MTPSVDGGTGGASFAAPPATVREDWRLRTLRPGDALYRAGDRAECVHWVAEGLLKLGIAAPGGKERIIALLGPGDLLGAIAPMTPEYQETAQALGHASVRSAPRQQLSPDSDYDLLRAATSRLEEMRESLGFAERPVTARLASTLLRLGERFGQSSEGGLVRLMLPLTHEHLAAMVGAARETTSSALGQMRSAGLLKGTRGCYQFERDELRRYLLRDR